LLGDRFTALIAGPPVGRDGDDLGAQHAAGRVPLGHREVHGLPHLDPEGRRAGGQRAADADPDVLPGELRRRAIHGIGRGEKEERGREKQAVSAKETSTAAGSHSNLPNSE
jgi:hypothetical protein